MTNYLMQTQPPANTFVPLLLACAAAAAAAVYPTVCCGRCECPIQCPTTVPFVPLLLLLPLLPLLPLNLLLIEGVGLHEIMTNPCQKYCGQPKHAKGW